MKKLALILSRTLTIGTLSMVAFALQAGTPQVFTTDPGLPPLNGGYVSPAAWHAAYAAGIIIRDVSHNKFTQNLPLPPLGNTQPHNFNSQLAFEVSTDNGVTYQPASGSANVSVDVTHTTDDPDGTMHCDTEMTSLQLSFSAGGPTILLRESPTLPSTGKTTTRAVAGGYMVSSFFDIFTEISTDGGATWQPALQAAHVELRNDASQAAPTTQPSPLLPPPGSEYVSPQQWHAAYAQGIIISNISHREFTASHPPPTTGSITHSFNSQLDVQFSADAGATFQYVRVSAPVLVEVTKVHGQGTDGLYDTEMLSLSFNLPGGIMVRESPTLPSRGQTQISSQADGTYSISSFFDVFTELSTDGGTTWSPSTTGPARVEMKRITPAQPATPTPDLPPANGQYVSPDQWHAAYAQGIIISNVSHMDFLQKQPPPPPGGSQIHNFGSAVLMLVSLDGGQTFIPASAQANVAVNVQSSQDYGNTRFFDTEMLQLSLNSISGAGIPPGMRLRESPTKASLGRTSIRLEQGTGQYRIDSFFDIFTELSLDGGATWFPNTNRPATVKLRTPPPTPVSAVCPADITVTASGPGGAVVTFTTSGSGGCGGPVTVTATPASGSLFPIGTTTVTVVATDPCGNTAKCTFHVTVNPAATTVPEFPFPQPGLPPLDGVYISPAQWHAAFANGIVIKDVRHRGFLQNFNPPPVGGTSVHTFHSTLDFQVSTTGPGGPFNPATGPADVTVRMTHSLDAAGKSYFDTEMLALSLTSGAMMIRESPSLPSRGQTTLRSVPGAYMISSFFDVFTELSVDGGVSWMPADQAGHVELRPDPKKVDPVTEPSPLLPPPNDQYISPQQWHILYNSGIVITNVRHKFFTQSLQPPASGSQIHSFNSVLDLEVSTDGGGTFSPIRVAVPTQVALTSAGSDGSGLYDTEMTMLGMPSGFVLPGTNIRLRESPTESSRGMTQLEQSGGSFQIDSFFDIFIELSTDGGVSWHSPDNGPVRMQLAPLAPEQTVPTPNVPPPGEYISPDKWHAYYQQGIIITNASHKIFTSQFPLPTSGSITDNFNTGIELDIILPGQAPQHVVGTAPCSARISTTTKDTLSVRYFDTELLSLTLTGLPGGVMVRESPTRQSTGRLSSRPDPNSLGQFRVSSFFDIFTEISTDGGATWFASTSAPPSMRLRSPIGVPAITITCPADIYATATSLAGVVVNYAPPIASGGCSAPTVTCTPASGSVFPIGTTTVTCVAQDSCGNKAVCTFKVIVRKPVKKRVFPSSNLPPPNGQYVSPADWHAAYAAGIYITNASHSRFTQSFPPPPPGGSDTHSFGSRVEFELRQPGQPPLHVIIPNVQVTVHISSSGTSGDDQVYDTEMLELSLQGGNLPAGIMLRESPTRQSTGQVRIQPTTGGFAISSFFDVFTELSLDNGQTWSPSDSPGRMELVRDTSNTSASINDVHTQAGDVVVTVPTQFGMYTFLECKDSLDDPSWITINGVVGDGSQSAQTDFYSSGLKQRYYRVRMQEVTHPNPQD